MSLESTNRIKSIIEGINVKTGCIHLDLKSAAKYLRHCYGGSTGSEDITAYDTDEDFESVNVLKAILNASNNALGVQHTNLTSAIQALCDGYVLVPPLYSFGITSDLHIQYATGYTDFQRALNYFDKKSLPFSCVCGDLTWAAKMVNASQYTSEWKGGLEDYKDIKGDRLVYAMGGNHETYVATYNTTTKTWSSVGSDFDVDFWKENTGNEPFYTVSNQPDDEATHNVCNPNLPDSDVFIMVSIKQASAPNLFFTAADGEDEFAWLQTVLEKNKNKRCYVFFHEHDNLDRTADPFQIYPAGISEKTEQGKAFIDLMRAYPNVIWIHGHTHTTFQEEYPPVMTVAERGYKSINVPSLQGPRKYDESTGEFVGMGAESEGYIVDVYEGFIVLKCLDFTTVNQDGTGEATVMEVYVLDTTLTIDAMPEHIEATFVQGDIEIYDGDTLDKLKPLLTVNVVYDDGTVVKTTDYKLSGTLTAGSSTITVSYLDMTTTFVVNVLSSSFTNQIPISVDASGNLYVGTNGEKGYKENHRLSSSGAESANTGTDITGFIPIAQGDILRFKDCQIVSAGSYERIFFYKKDKTRIGYVNPSTNATIVWPCTFDANNYLTSITCTPPSNESFNLSEVGFVRICATNIDVNSIITVNEEIE